MNKQVNILISGGGTGGHIFPAIAIAQAIQRILPDANILFVGAKGKMEMQKVPDAGYHIEGLNITGFQRSLSLKNLMFPFKLIKSLGQARRIIKRFKPDVAIGVGGFASGPTLYMAARMGIPCLIQEQNAFPGITNKLLAKRVQKICVAYQGMETFFPANKIRLTGNPVRNQITETEGKKQEAIQHFGLDKDKPTVLIVGGSLGARSINRAVLHHLEAWQNMPFQLLWQTGQLSYQEVKEGVTAAFNPKNIHVTAFIKRMDLAYAAADLVISRAGAIAISEMSLVGLPVIFVPFPYAAEDHQSKNAQSLVDKEAAWTIADKDVDTQLLPLVEKIMADAPQRVQKAQNIKQLAQAHAEDHIAEEALALAGVDVDKKPATQTNKTPQKVFFLGIGGIGMSALARYYLLHGAQVMGYDRTQSAITDALAKEGAHIFYEDKAELLPQDWLQDNTTLFIYTPAIPDNSALKQRVIQADKTWRKRAEVLGMLSKDYKTLAVAGTHGKTTSSSILAHIVEESEQAGIAFLGGISKNMDSNFLWQDKAEYMVVEADEFDRSFLHLHPHIALITAIDADHLDIYGNITALKNTFKTFAKQVNGQLIVKYGLKQDFEAYKPLTYSLKNADSDFYADNIELHNGRYRFDICYPKGRICNVELPMPGLVNVENAIAASAVAKYIGVSDEEIRMALKHFQGIKRRMDKIVETEEHIFIDDYAHHPEEIAAAIGSVKALYPQLPLCVVFQPHLYSRTRDFAEAFAKSLEQADRIILLDIYPARELPIEGVSSELILNYIQNPNKSLMSKTDLLSHIENQKPPLLLTLGAGDIDKIITNLKTIYHD